MATLKPLEHLGYMIKQKGKNLYLTHDCMSINAPAAWGKKDLTKIQIYKSIEDAQRIKSDFNKHKSDYFNIKDVELEILLVHKKEVMMAKLKGSQDDTE